MFNLAMQVFLLVSKAMLRFFWAYLVYTWGGLHRYFGNVNAMRSEHERAVHYFAKAYEIDPTWRRVRYERAVLLGRELGQYEEALTEFTALLEEDEAFGLALFNRAMVYQDLARYEEAETDLTHYLTLPETAENQKYRPEAERLLRLIKSLHE